MLEKRAYWIGGSLTAFLGVGLVRLLSPELGGGLATAAAAAGYALVTLGITILACATRRGPSESFISVETDEKGRGGP